MFNEMKIHKLENDDEEKANAESLEMIFEGSPLSESTEKLPQHAEEE
jgi:hypothetical protein